MYNTVKFRSNFFFYSWMKTVLFFFFSFLDFFFFFNALTGKKNQVELN